MQLLKVHSNCHDLPSISSNCGDLAFHSFQLRWSCLPFVPTAVILPSIRSNCDDLVFHSLQLRWSCLPFVLTAVILPSICLPSLFSVFSLDDLFQQEPALTEDGSRFVGLITKLMERLLDYRSVVKEDDNIDNRMSCTVNVLVRIFLVALSPLPEYKFSFPSLHTFLKATLGRSLKRSDSPWVIGSYILINFHNYWSEQN